MVFFLAYAIGSMFLDIFDTSTSTILQCFIADEEMFDEGNYFADRQLQKWFDDQEIASRPLRPVT